MLAKESRGRIRAITWSIAEGPSTGNAEEPEERRASSTCGAFAISGKRKPGGSTPTIVYAAGSRFNGGPPAVGSGGRVQVQRGPPHTRIGAKPPPPQGIGEQRNGRAARPVV